jgi:hypothetical protein
MDQVLNEFSVTRKLLGLRILTKKQSCVQHRISCMRGSFRLIFQAA